MLRTKASRILSVGSSLIPLVAFLALAGWPVGGATSSLVGSLALDGESIAVAATPDVAYVLALNSNGLYLNAVSIDDPAFPELLSSTLVDTSTSRDVGIAACDGWVLIRIDSAGVWIYPVDARDPGSPVVGAGVLCGSTVCSTKGLGSLSVIPATVRPVAQGELAKNAMRFEGVLYYADGDLEASSCASGQSRAQQVLATPGDASDVWAIDDLLFVADGEAAGLTVIRTEHPTSDAEAFVRATGWVSTNTPGSAEAVVVAGDLALVADGAEGLAILSVAPLTATGRDGEPAAPVLVGNVDTPGIATDVVAVNDLAVVADGPEGIQIVRVASPELSEQSAPFESRIVDISPPTASVPASYSILLRTDNPLVAGTDTITIRFPLGVSFVASPRKAPVPLGLLPGPDVVAPDALPDGSVEFKVEDKAAVGFPKIDLVTERSSIGDARWNDDTRELTLTVPRDVGAGQTVLITIQRSAGITTPPHGTRYVLHLKTSQHPMPAATINTFSIEPNDWLSSIIRMMSVTPDTELANSSCVVAFETSLVGDLDVGDTIEVTFPPGMALRAPGACGPVHIQIGAAAPVLAAGAVAVAPVLPEGPTVTIPVPSTIPARTRVAIYFGKKVSLVNPPFGTNYTVSVSTSADPVPIHSDPYTIRPIEVRVGDVGDQDDGEKAEPERVRVRNIQPPYGRHRSRYDIYVTTSSSEKLSGASGDTITVTFPYETKLSERYDQAEVSVNGRPATLRVGLSPSVAEVVLPSDLEISAGETVVLQFRDVINPPAGTAYEIAVHTSAEPEDAFSNPYDIVDEVTLADETLEDLGGKLDQLIALLQQNAAQEQATLESLRAELAGLRSALSNLSGDLLGRLQQILDELSDQSSLSGSIRQILREIRDCLESLEFTGTAIPPAERMPVHVVLTIDVSGSMGDNDPDNDRESGALELVARLDPAKDFVGVVTWDDAVDVSLNPTHDFDTVRDALSRITEDGGTSFDAGLRAAVEMLEGVSGDSKVIVFLTDGEPQTYTPPGTSGSWVDRAKAAGIRIYAIGLGDRYSEPDIRNRLETMASVTGGAAFHAQHASDLVQVYNAIASALAGPWQIELQGGCDD